MTDVLLTRPEEASLQLAGQLAGVGIRSIVMPFYSFSSHPPRIDLQKALAQSSGRQLAVFTSPRAVQYGLEHIPEQITGELRYRLEFAAIGPATRAQLEDAGVKVQLQAATGFTSEDLLGMPELASEAGNAYIFCAPGGRQKLAAGLRELGWQVSMLEVYQRQPLRPAQGLVDELTTAGRILSVWTSISALDLAREYLPEAAWSKILHAPALVISVRIKHHLQQAGATRVALAEGPGNSGLFQSIQAQLNDNEQQAIEQ